MQWKQRHENWSKTQKCIIRSLVWSFFFQLFFILVVDRGYRCYSCIHITNRIELVCRCRIIIWRSFFCCFGLWCEYESMFNKRRKRLLGSCTYHSSWFMYVWWEKKISNCQKADVPSVQLYRRTNVYLFFPFIFFCDLFNFACDWKEVELSESSNIEYIRK